MTTKRENLMADLYEQAKGQPLSELLKLYYERARFLGFTDSGIIMTTLHDDLAELVSRDGGENLPTREAAEKWLENYRNKKLMK